jgi:hypothetical protein
MEAYCSEYILWFWCIVWYESTLYSILVHILTCGPVLAVFASLLVGSHVSHFAPAIQLYGLSTYFHYLSLYVVSITNTSNL